MNSVKRAAILVGLFLSTGLWAEQLTLTADQVLDKYIEAVGGAEKLDGVSTFYERIEVIGDFARVNVYRAPTGPKSHGVGQAYFKASPMSRISWVRNDKDELIAASGCDGKDFWVYSPRKMQKWKVTTEHEYSCKPGMPLLPLSEVALRGDWTQLRRENAKLEMRGQKEVGGRTTFTIRAEAPGHQALTFYIDSQNYLLLRVDSTIEFEHIPLVEHVTHLYSDYTDVAGIKLPFRIERHGDNTDEIINVQHVEMNVPLEDKVFERPNW